MRAASWTDPTAGLASGDADAALLRLPFPGQDSLRVEVLFTEPRWVALPASHPLASRDQIAFHELWDEPFVAAPAETPQSAARYYARPGIAYRPLTGVSPSQVGVAWPPDADTNPVIQDFVRCCLENKPAQDPENPT
jgi:DNA-binding transcriptional LysR family regulator